MMASNHSDTGQHLGGMARLYIGQLPDRSKAEQIKEYFEPYGRILQIELKHGYGFIDYENESSVETAVSDAHGKEFMGSILRVERARSAEHGEKKTQRSTGSSGGGSHSSSFKRIPPGPAPGVGGCFKCGEEGHWAKECTDFEKQEKFAKWRSSQPISDSKGRSSRDLRLSSRRGDSSRHYDDEREASPVSGARDYAPPYYDPYYPRYPPSRQPPPPGHYSNYPPPPHIPPQGPPYGGGGGPPYLPHPYPPPYPPYGGGERRHMEDERRSYEGQPLSPRLGPPYSSRDLPPSRPGISPLYPESKAAGERYPYEIPMPYHPYGGPANEGGDHGSLAYSKRAEPYGGEFESEQNTHESGYYSQDSRSRTIPKSTGGYPLSSSTSREMYTESENLYKGPPPLSRYPPQPIPPGSYGPPPGRSLLYPTPGSYTYPSPESNAKQSGFNEYRP